MAFFRMTYSLEGTMDVEADDEQAAEDQAWAICGKQDPFNYFNLDDEELTAEQIDEDEAQL